MILWGNLTKIMKCIIVFIRRIGTNRLSGIKGICDSVLI